MNIQDLLQKYPTKRIKADDGMAVTAAVWDEAHEYHRQSQGLLTLFSQGVGILTGLEVAASDPPDTSVYISPGIAVDEAGQTIVLSQPVAYDVGHDMEGLLHLLLSYGEGQARYDNGHQEGQPRYVQDEFSISAQTTLPDTPFIELARVQRSNRKAIFLDAVNPVQPGLDELDLRFRREVGPPREARIAVSYLGEMGEKKQGVGVGYLAQALNHAGDYRVFVEDDVPIGPNIVSNALVYLVGRGKFELSAGVMNGLRNYVHRGNGTLLIESMDEAAETSFMDFLKAKDMLPKPVAGGNRLLTQPHLFAAPPAGYETQGNPQVLVGEGVVFSSYNYGLLWQGERSGRLASREEIRTAVEWGSNIVRYALGRQRG